MRDVEYLAKDDHIKFKSTNYKAISEEKVTSTVRESLIKNKLIIIPVKQEHSREGTLSTVNVQYKIIDIESGESEIIVSSGTGVDTQDKGVGKAMTYAYKYLLLRTFAIPTGEDPDKTSSAELDSQVKKKANTKATARQKSDIENKVKELSKLTGTPAQKYYEQALKISDLQTIEKSHAEQALTALDKWINTAKGAAQNV